MIATATRATFHPQTQAYFQDRTVVVTGAGGFIGGYVLELLLALGAKPIAVVRRELPETLSHLRSEVLLLQGDLAEPRFAQECTLSGVTVLHLAAHVGGIQYNRQHSATLFHRNVVPFLNLVDAAARRGVHRFLTVSSACVYASNCSIPTPESEGYVGEPEPSNLGYGWAKRIEERASQWFAQEFDLPVVIARPYNAYGPRDDFDPETCHVIPSLIRRAWQCDGTLTVWGNGQQTRSFLYAEDFARGLLELTARGPLATPVHLGSPEEITIGALAEEIAQAVGALQQRSLRVAFDPKGPMGQNRRVGDLQLLEERLQFRCLVPWKEGIRRTVRWFQAQL